MRPDNLHSVFSSSSFTCNLFENNLTTKLVTDVHSLHSEEYHSHEDFLRGDIGSPWASSWPCIVHWGGSDGHWPASNINIEYSSWENFFNEFYNLLQIAKAKDNTLCWLPPQNVYILLLHLVVFACSVPADGRLSIEGWVIINYY